MTAYPNDDKQMYLDRVRAHRLADELIRGIGWETDGPTRGCAVGCTLHAYDHGAYPEELGVPVQLAYLEDWLFENLPEGYLEWPELFLSAIRPGADLTGVWPAWVRRMLARRLVEVGDGTGYWRHQVRKAIQDVSDLYARGMPKAAAAHAVAAAHATTAAHADAVAARVADPRVAYAYAATAATAAARFAYAADAAYAAATAADAAAYAAHAADAAAASAGDSRNTEITMMANDLIETLRAA